MAQSILIRKADGTFEFLKSDGSGRLEAAISGITGTVNTQLTGSIAEYTWDASDPNPDPGASVRAFGVKHDAGVFTPYYWDGTSWEAI